MRIEKCRIQPSLTTTVLRPEGRRDMRAGAGHGTNSVNSAVSMGYPVPRCPKVGQWEYFVRHIRTNSDKFGQILPDEDKKE